MIKARWKQRKRQTNLGGQTSQRLNLVPGTGSGWALVRVANPLNGLSLYPSGDIERSRRARQKLVLARESHRVKEDQLSRRGACRC
ncbi:uncharacterized protein STEHIDRAFT_145435 [Stereum hirsutum FP-91666 SS1]|uniref:uncharacterized protein n=1 Tax=Stereum hirsutum (strain FP-91666) TaxID=721885 RepID=UPI000440E4AB|nr:uncharacterized protein STEHIDRAFT_145435 [Stereum hirsutum FP-91666 SS1]EIM90333.1 hypothetical protein STEHIDRAFT_145435 [Stereum hirsutum FP-91666 SS1]